MTATVTTPPVPADQAGARLFTRLSHAEVSGVHLGTFSDLCVSSRRMAKSEHHGMFAAVLGWSEHHGVFAAVLDWKHADSCECAFLETCHA